MFNRETGKYPMHIFLKGDEGIGKSALLSKVLEMAGVPYCGLKSVAVTAEEDGVSRCRLYLVPAAEKSPKLEEANLAAVMEEGKAVLVNDEVFNTVGAGLLSASEGVGLVLLDEVGSLEENARMYTEAVLGLLDRTDITVIGAVRDDADTALANAIRSHRNVKTFRISEENRDRMPPVMLRLLRFERRD